MCHMVAYHYCGTVSLVFAYYLLFNERIFKMKGRTVWNGLTNYHVIAAILCPAYL